MLLILNNFAKKIFLPNPISSSDSSFSSAAGFSSSFFSSAAPPLATAAPPPDGATAPANYLEIFFEQINIY